MRLSIIIGCFLLMVGCLNADVNMIDDEYTVIEPNVLEEVDVGMITIEYKLDNMGRSRSEYHIQEDGAVVIDPNVQEAEIQRGDIVYFETPSLPEEMRRQNPNRELSDNHLARVVALPEEKIKIEAGKIYINDRKLNSFYGRVNRAGMTEEKYIEFQKEKDSKFVLSEQLEDYFRQDMGEIEVPLGHIFVIGDRWWRSVDSRHYGPLSMDKVRGIVVGVTKEYAR